MYSRSIRHPHHVTPAGQRQPLKSHPPPHRMANPYLARRNVVHSRDMPNPYAFPAGIPAPNIPPTRVMEPVPSHPSWQLQPRYEARSTFVSAQHVLETGFGNFSPRSLDRDIDFQFGIPPTSNEPEVADLDYGEWHRDADATLDSLGTESFDFGSVSSNLLLQEATAEDGQEAALADHSSKHEKMVLKTHEQFIRMLRCNKATEALAFYDGSFDFQFYRIFQGPKTTAKKNAMNNIFSLWSKLFFHRKDGLPYQPNCFMLLLHSLFGEFSRRGVRYSLSKDFNYRGGFMRNLEHRWNKHALADDTFGARPTKTKMPEDYAKNIRHAVSIGLLDPVNDVEDCQLLFACACGTMLAFRGNQVG
jgi:hypothetical protein